MLTTIFGAEGFVGASLRDELLSRGLPAIAPSNGEIPDGPMGTILYAAPHTSKYGWSSVSASPHDPEFLLSLLNSGRYTQFLYLSSADVYSHVEGKGREDSAIPVDISRPGEGSLLAWLSDEIACLRFTPKSRIIRLGRVYSEDAREGGILGQLIQSSLTAKQIEMPFAMQSSLDFIGIENAVSAILHIAGGCEHRCYNVGSGFNTEIADIAECLRRVTGSVAHSAESAGSLACASIAIDRIQQEFGFVGTNLLRDLPMIVRDRLHQLGPSAAA